MPSIASMSGYFVVKTMMLHLVADDHHIIAMYNVFVIVAQLKTINFTCYTYR